MRRAVALLLCIGLLGLSADAGAQQSSSWNGTWIGNWESGNGTQIVFAGDLLVAMYWDGDYLSDTRSSLSADGRAVTINWPAGDALLTRDGETSGHIVIREKGQPDAAFDVKRDNQ